MRIARHCEEGTVRRGNPYLQERAGETVEHERPRCVPVDARRIARFGDISPPNKGNKSLDKNRIFEIIGRDRK
ncbi:hypothetical protein DRQ36_09065 [bacterium]|nr:MAG: hypothetical protein DRQ36_09065 [bacterium]